MTVQLINVGLLLLVFSCLPKSRVNGESKYEEILFPNGSPNRNSSPRDKYSRALATPDPNNPPEGVDDAVCVICHGLEYCDVLNGLLIEEVYYPRQDELGTCSIIEALGIRMDSEIFGIGRTFRDTPQCRDIVMQYLCLFWGSQNDMYTNLCFWKEDVSSPDPDQHKISPRPPCRSFCVQVCIVNDNCRDRSANCCCLWAGGRSRRCAPTKRTSSTYVPLSSAPPQKTSARQVHPLLPLF